MTEAADETDAPEPLDTTQPFKRSAGLRAGLGKRIRANDFRQIIHGIYVEASVPDSAALTAQAVLLPYPVDAWASHATAARAWGLPIPPLPGEHVTVLARQQRRARAGITCHYTATEGSLLPGASIRISDAKQVFLELASQLSLVDLVVVGDHIVRKGYATLEALRKHCATSTIPGAAHARAAAAFVRAGVDSPMETRLRLLIVLAGLPEPEVNPLMDLPGGWRRYDLCWRSARLVVEYDGRHHIERVEQWESDIERREEIEDDDWRMLIVTAKGIFNRPDLTLAKIHRVLLKRREPDTPKRLADAWRHHFPVRRDYLDPAS